MPVTNPSTHLDDTDEYLTVAAQAVRTSGAAALDSLGWWELLGAMHDPDQRAAVFALFQAQGRELAASPAIGGLLAQPYLDGTGIAPGTVVAAVPRLSPRRGTIHVVVGELGGRQVLVDRPGHGAVVAGGDALEVRAIDVPGRLPFHEIDVDWSQATPMVTEEVAAGVRERAAFLGRVALGLEILGAAEGAVGLAVEHAANRVQFGEPIGRFQAVRHLLAWARTDCVAVELVARQTVALDADAPPRTGEVLKALAGRNGRRACERALQVLGGIGFTAEHDHHHHHGRVLALDALLGSSAALTHELGAWLRGTGADPGFAAAALLGGPAGG